VGYWSTIEVPVGIICACLPAVRQLFSKVFPQMFGTTRPDNSYAYGSRVGTSKLSANPGRMGASTVNSGNIKIKQEWTVMSNSADNRSDVELVSFDEQIANRDAVTRKVTLGKRIDGGRWSDESGHTFPIQGSRV
jgi:hypothetical protein